MKMRLAALAVAWVGLASPALAQSTMGNFTAGVNWGTGGSTMLDSALMHATQGVVAGQVKSAESGTLTTSNVSNYAIGVQSIVNNNGDNNSISASQNGTNSGSVTNKGQISSGNGGNNN